MSLWPLNLYKPVSPLISQTMISVSQEPLANREPSSLKLRALMAFLCPFRLTTFHNLKRSKSYKSIHRFQYSTNGWFHRNNRRRRCSFEDFSGSLWSRLCLPSWLFPNQYKREESEQDREANLSNTFVPSFGFHTISDSRAPLTTKRPEWSNWASELGEAMIPNDLSSEYLKYVFTMLMPPFLQRKMNDKVTFIDWREEKPLNQIIVKKWKIMEKNFDMGMNREKNDLREYLFFHNRILYFHGNIESTKTSFSYTSISYKYLHYRSFHRFSSLQIKTRIFISIKCIPLIIGWNLLFINKTKTKMNTKRESERLFTKETINTFVLLVIIKIPTLLDNPHNLHPLLHLHTLHSHQ